MSDSEWEALVLSFKASLKERRRIISALDWASGVGAYLEFRQQVHKLAGIATSYGFDHLGEVALEIDEQMPDSLENLEFTLKNQFEHWRVRILKELDQVT
jgi:HPt (histidine-containing phosphotransfer) domain-containing protein